MLTDEQLQAVRDRLNNLKNPDWWGYEDEASAKEAIEKASKFSYNKDTVQFLMKLTQQLHKRSKTLLELRMN